MKPKRVKKNAFREDGEQRTNITLSLSEGAIKKAKRMSKKYNVRGKMSGLAEALILKTPEADLMGMVKE